MKKIYIHPEVEVLVIEPTEVFTGLSVPDGGNTDDGDVRLPFNPFL